MLFELHLEFGDGCVETTIVHADEDKIYPQRDGIVHSGCKRFRYKVDKHNILPKTIVRFMDKTVIYPSGVECHPKTTLDDVVEIQTEQQIQKESKIEIVVPVEKREWKFESSSGGGTYIVTENKNGTFRCNCPGVWRSKDRRCKHIKEVENQ
jgi:hypothetical protein